MILFILSISACFQCVVLSTLDCIDWQGKKISDGEEFYPKANDHCFLCRCHQGYETMCKTVSCAPPSCPHLKIEGECCQFECLDKNGFGTGMDNITGVPPGGGGVEGSPTDSTMTDLGLRLVASTVTTFLILALLLFLIHRFRQRRLLMTLRRYSRRRDPLDDMDSINYTPDFFGIQCPPYEDPPPPYTPPKPQPGEEPPPYEAIEGSGNQQQGGGQQGETFTSSNCDRNCHNANRNLLHNNDGNSNSPLHEVSNSVTGVTSCSRGVINHNGSVITSSGNVINSNGNVIPANGSPRNGSNLSTGHQHAMCGSNCSGPRNESNQGSQQVTRTDNSCNNAIEHNSFQQHAGACRLQGLELTNTADNNNHMSVHFRNSSNGPPGITMGVLNRNRNNRNRYSDGIFNSSPVRNTPNRNTLSENTAALNLELRNTVKNFRYRNQQTSNCSHSNGMNTGDLSSSTTDIGESTTSAESLSSSPESPNFETDVKSIERHSVDILGDDANSTVKRFLDRQFGPVQKNRRYPTTMSQSWTSAQVSQTGQNFRQSISLGSFPPKTESQTVRKSSSSVSTAQPVNHQNLSRSKSEHLKTNGSLINQPYKGAIKSPSRTAPYQNHGVRVAYKEPDELSHTNRHSRNSCNFNLNSTNHSLENIVDLNVSEYSNTSMDSARLATAILDPGDIIVTRRQDELRKLRLTHLLHKPMHSVDNRHIDNSNSFLPSSRPLQRSLSENSVNSTSVCSETGERHGGDVAIGNDSQYPITSYKNFLYSCLASAGKSSLPETRPQPLGCSESKKSNVVVEDSASGSTSTQSSCKSTPKRENAKLDVRRKLPDVSMIHSWHGGQVDSGDENVSLGGFSMNTLGRNVNRNFDKKTCMDKDVSNMFFPMYKPINADIEIDRNCVPSSKMRACASQLYNYETEDRSGKKDKKRNLFKRHSAGCFPVKHDSQVCCNQSPRISQKQYQRMKSSRPQDRQSSHRVSENSQKDSPRRRMSSKDRKSSQKLLQNSNKDCSPKVTDLTPPYLVQSYPPPDRPTSLNVHTIDVCDSTDLLASNAQTQTGKVEKKRSKSLGRNESHSTHRSASSSRSSQSRKKKHSSRQGVLETHLFHQELEHVLCQQKSPIKSTTSQTRCPSAGVDKKCAITQV